MKTFTLVRRQVSDVSILDVVGDLVLCPETHLMRQQIEGVMEEGHRKILLNLARVNYVDSTGMGVLVGAKTAALARNVQLKLCCVPTLVAQLLGHLQLTKLLDVHDQESLALDSFS